MTKGVIVGIILGAAVLWLILYLLPSNKPLSKTQSPSPITQQTPTPAEAISQKMTLGVPIALDDPLVETISVVYVLHGKVNKIEEKQDVKTGKTYIVEVWSTRGVTKQTFNIPEEKLKNNQKNKKGEYIALGDDITMTVSVNPKKSDQLNDQFIIGSVQVAHLP